MRPSGPWTAGSPKRPSSSRNTRTKRSSRRCSRASKRSLPSSSPERLAIWRSASPTPPWGRRSSSRAETAPRASRSSTPTTSATPSESSSRWVWSWCSAVRCPLLRYHQSSSILSKMMRVMMLRLSVCVRWDEWRVSSPNRDRSSWRRRTGWNSPVTEAITWTEMRSRRKPEYLILKGWLERIVNPPPLWIFSGHSHRVATPLCKGLVSGIWTSQSTANKETGASHKNQLSFLFSSIGVVYLFFPSFPTTYSQLTSCLILFIFIVSTLPNTKHTLPPFPFPSLFKVHLPFLKLKYRSLCFVSRLHCPRQNSLELLVLIKLILIASLLFFKYSYL